MVNKRTRFSGIHPYPAMIADDLAHSIAAEVMTPRCRVLDPFCGTGRTLLAGAYNGVYAVGMDVNPLGLLIAEAKASTANPSALRKLISCVRVPRVAHSYDLECGRKTEWFSAPVKKELAEIISWINGLELERSTLAQVAAVLSATTREVSYCRNHQWKLHRMSARHRIDFDVSPWKVFSRRMGRFIEEAETVAEPTSEFKFVSGNACNLSAALKASGEDKLFDVVFTSPPYGDSRTTVSYGGISSICLGVLQHLRALKTTFCSAGDIDRTCLGGRALAEDVAECVIDKYWRGGQNNPGRERVHRYLNDLGRACREIAKMSRRNSTAVFVVARRSVSGRRLYLDQFVADQMNLWGFELHSVETRRLLSKTAPRSVNAMARANIPRVVATMREEFVVRLHRGKNSASRV